MQSAGDLREQREKRARTQQKKVGTSARSDRKKDRNVFRPAKNNVYSPPRLARIETSPKIIENIGLDENSTTRNAHPLHGSSTGGVVTSVPSNYCVCGVVKASVRTYMCPCASA